jgi:hypothetical protein
MIDCFRTNYSTLVLYFERIIFIQLEISKEVIMANLNVQTPRSSVVTGDGNIALTVEDIVSRAQRAGADITHNTKRFVNWYSNLGFAEKAIFSQIPFAGDVIDLGIQAHRLATGKGVDPVVVVLSSLGLGADIAASATFGGLQGINASLALVKSSYQSMSQVAKMGLKAIFEAAAQSPNAMRGLRDLIPEIASLAGSGKLGKLLEDPKYVKFAKAKIANFATDKSEDLLRDNSKSRVGGSKDNEKISISTATELNDINSLAQKRFDVIAADLEKQKLPVNEKNIQNILDETNLSTKSVESILEIAKQVSMSSSQMTLG